MLQKFLFLSVIIVVLFEHCDSSPSQTGQIEKNSKTDTISIQGAVFQSTTHTVVIPLSKILPKKGVDYIPKIYFDTLMYDNKRLLFTTRDSALTVYQQMDTTGTFLLKIPIDSTDLYTYTDGSPLFLKDMDGDNQKEVLVTVDKNGNHLKFRVYRLVKNNTLIGLKKISRFDDLINPEFDPTSGMVRTHWFDRDDYELDEFYKISKDDALVFVKGLERQKGKVRKYEKKAGW